MGNTREIKLPNGDFLPIPKGAKLLHTEEADIYTLSNTWTLKVFSDGSKVQMITYPLGMESQTEWTKKGVIRRSWDEMGRLRFRIIGRFSDMINVSHETCYEKGELRHVDLTFLALNTLKVIHLIKKKDKVSILLPSTTGEFKEELIPDFPKGKRLMRIRSISDLEKLDNTRQRN